MFSLQDPLVRSTCFNLSGISELQILFFFELKWSLEIAVLSLRLSVLKICDVSGRWYGGCLIRPYKKKC